MGKRILKLNEDDLVSFLGPALRSSGYMAEDQDIEGFTYSTRKIRKGGDFYKDVISDPMDTSEAEEVKFIKVLMSTRRRKKSEETDATTDDEASEGQEDG